MAAPLRAACFKTNSNCNANSVCRIVAMTKRLAHKHQSDFFGIAEDQSSAKNGEEHPVLDAEIHKLVRPLLKKRQKNMEIVMQTAFGQIRLDNQANHPLLEDVKPNQFLQVISDSNERSKRTSTNGKQSNRSSKSKQQNISEKLEHRAVQVKERAVQEGVNIPLSVQKSVTTPNLQIDIAAESNCDHHMSSFPKDPVKEQNGWNFADGQYFAASKTPTTEAYQTFYISKRPQARPTDVGAAEGNKFDQQYFDSSASNSIVTAIAYSSKDVQQGKPVSKDADSTQERSIADCKFDARCEAYTSYTYSDSCSQPESHFQTKTEAYDVVGQRYKTEPSVISEAEKFTNQGDNFIDQFYFQTLNAPGSPCTAIDKDTKKSFIDQQYFPQHLNEGKGGHHQSLHEQDTESENSSHNLSAETGVLINGDFPTHFANCPNSNFANRTNEEIKSSSRRITDRKDLSECVLKTQQCEDFTDIKSQYLSSSVDNQLSFCNHSHSSPFGGFVTEYGVSGSEAGQFSDTFFIRTSEHDKESQLGVEPSIIKSLEHDYSHIQGPVKINPEKLSKSRVYEKQNSRQPHADKSAVRITNVTYSDQFIARKQQELDDPREILSSPASDKHFPQSADGQTRRKGSREGAVKEERAQTWVTGQKRTVTEKPNIASDEDGAFNTAMTMRKNMRHNLKPEQSTDDLSKNKAQVLLLKDQVPDLQHMPSADVAKLLADSVIYENDDFIAVNKPYGLPSHGGPGVRVSVGQVLDMVARHVDKGRSQFDSLYLIHRLDKETTGVMLLAKTAEVAWRLLGMFRRREVTKVYWTVTKGVPKPTEGIVDIPLVRHSIMGVYKTVVRPKEFLSDGKMKKSHDNQSKEAVTRYSVLAEKDSMALVECCPRTGIQHQIRAHLAQALNAPVLGDHKYSHTDRLAPQKLFPEALQKLGIRQAQVRYLPMHLHAKQLVLPEWRGQTNVFIKASIPKFFLRNLQRLQIQIPFK